LNSHFIKHFTFKPKGKEIVLGTKNFSKEFDSTQEKEEKWNNAK